MKFRGKPSSAEKASLVCDVFILLIFLWDQLRYGMDMLALIVPLFAIGVFLAFSIAFPEEYSFTEDMLEIGKKWHAPIKIPYESVFNYESVSHDSFINLLMENKVKVYFTDRGKKKVKTCLLGDVDSFVEALRTRCPEFQEEQKSKLEVFFTGNKGS